MTEPHALCDVIKAQQLSGRIVWYTATMSLRTTYATDHHEARYIIVIVGSDS